MWQYTPEQPLMLAQALIEKKRDRGHLDAAEWQALTLAYGSGEIADYQMAAFLMAVITNSPPCTVAADCV